MSRKSNNSKSLYNICTARTKRKSFVFIWSTRNPTARRDGIAHVSQIDMTPAAFTVDIPISVRKGTRWTVIIDIARVETQTDVINSQNERVFKVCFRVSSISPTVLVYTF